MELINSWRENQGPDILQKSLRMEGMHLLGHGIGI